MKAEDWVSSDNISGYDWHVLEQGDLQTHAVVAWKARQDLRPHYGHLQLCRFYYEDLNAPQQAAHQHTWITQYYAPREMLEKEWLRLQMTKEN